MSSGLTHSFYFFILKTLNFNVILFYVYECFLPCMYVHRMYAWYPQRSKEGVRSLGTGVIGSCEPPCVRPLLSGVVVSKQRAVTLTWLL